MNNKQQEYRMTYMWRILALIVLLPISYFSLSISIFASEVPSASDMFWGKLIGLSFPVILALTWAYGYSKKVVLSSNALSTKSLFENKSLFINEHTKFIHKSVVINNAVGLSVGGHLVQALANTQGAEASTSITLKVFNKETKIKLNSNIKGIIDLREKLIALETKHVYPSFKSLYDSGTRVSFGPVILQSPHLKIGKKSVLINDIQNISLEKGRMIIKVNSKKRAFAKIKTNKITNMHSMLKIIAN